MPPPSGQNLSKCPHQPGLGDRPEVAFAACDFMGEPCRKSLQYNALRATHSFPLHASTIVIIAAVTSEKLNRPYLIPKMIRGKALRETTP